MEKNNFIRRLTAFFLVFCILSASLSFGTYAEIQQIEIVKVYGVPKSITVDRAKGQSYSLPKRMTCRDADDKTYTLEVTWENEEYRSYLEGTFEFTAVLKDKDYKFADSCLPKVMITNNINGDFDASVSRKYYFDHENDFLDFDCYYTENDYTGTDAVYPVRLAEKNIAEYWNITNSVALYTHNRSLNTGWNGLARASNVSTVLLRDFKLYNFRLELDYTHGSDWWYPYVLFGVQNPTQFFGKLNIGSAGNRETGENTDLVFDESTIPGGVYAYVEQEGNINLYGAVDDDGYGRLYFDNDISVDKNVLSNYNRNVKHHMSITITNGEFALKIDDSDLFCGNIDDGAIGGLIGFGACTSDITFDNFQITALDENGEEIALKTAEQGFAPEFSEDNYTGWNASRCPLEYIWGNGFDQSKW